MRHGIAKSTSWPPFLLSLIGLFFLFTACEDDTVIHQQRSIPIEGWEQFDTVTFVVDSLPDKGNYLLSIDIRTTSEFPYQSLYLKVDQTWNSPLMVRTDTLCCPIATPDGDIIGSGISHFQYTFPLVREQLNSGQHGLVSIRHVMQRDILPGIANVGIKLEKESE